jgi:hypothetical protein
MPNEKDEEFCLVDRTYPAPDECNILFLHLIRQSIEDFKQLKDKSKEEFKEAFLTASGFMFDDDYYIDWGDKKINLESICTHLNLDIEWVRRQILQQVKVKLQQGVVVAVKPGDPEC